MDSRTAPIVLCGSISKHPSGMGAAMHNAGYRSLGLPWSYVPFACEDLAGALHGMRALGLRGFGVSMPYKLSVLPLLDRLDPLAERIGAVNTIVNDQGVLTGYNTDADGAADALTEACELRDAKVLIVGTGGAARAVAHGLHNRGAQICITGRTPAHVQQLARPHGWATLDLAALTASQRFTAVVQCTPVGMDAHPGMALSPSQLHPDTVLMDIVYKPVRTELLVQAQKQGLRTLHGGRMLLHQALRQFALYTQMPAPREAMETALEKFIA